MGVFFSNSAASFGFVAYRNLRCASDLNGISVNFTTKVQPYIVLRAILITLSKFTS